MEFIISPEEYRASAAAFVDYTKKQQNTAKTRAGIVLAAMVFAIVFFIFSSIERKDNKPFAQALSILADISIIVSSCTLIAETQRIKKHQLLFLHFKADRNFQNAAKAHVEAPFTQQTVYTITAAMNSEKNMFIKHSIGSLLTTNKIYMGDMDGAYPCLVNDPAIFAADRLFEMKYYYDLIDYYANLGDPANCREYVQQAYQSFMNACRAYTGAKTFTTAETAAGAMALTAYTLGEWQVCFDINKMRLEAYNTALMSGNAAARADVALMKLMQAECLYNLKEYRAALILCDEAGPVLGYIGRQSVRANTLAEKLHKALDETGAHGV